MDKTFIIHPSFSNNSLSKSSIKEGIAIDEVNKVILTTVIFLKLNLPGMHKSAAKLES